MYLMEYANMLHIGTRLQCGKYSPGMATLQRVPGIYSPYIPIIAADVTKDYLVLHRAGITPERCEPQGADKRRAHDRKRVLRR